MRLRISLAAEGAPLRVPVQYNHLVQGLVYNNLDQALSDWLHEKGHAYGARRFKLFTFSRLFGKRDAENGRIRFGGPVHFYLGAVDAGGRRGDTRLARRTSTEKTFRALGQRGVPTHPPFDVRYPTENCYLAHGEGVWRISELFDYGFIAHNLVVQYRPTGNTLASSPLIS